MHEPVNAPHDADKKPDNQSPQQATEHDHGELHLVPPHTSHAPEPPPNTRGQGQLSARHLLRLQRARGNQFVLRQLKSTTPIAELDEETPGEETTDKPIADGMNSDIATVLPNEGEQSDQNSDTTKQNDLNGDSQASTEDIPEDEAAIGLDDGWSSETSLADGMDNSLGQGGDNLEDLTALPQDDTTLGSADIATPDLTGGAMSDLGNIMSGNDKSPVEDAGVVQRWSLRGLVSGVVDTLSSAAQSALGGIRSRVEGLVGSLQSGWNGLKSMASSAAQTVRQGIQTAGQQLGNLARTAMSGLQSGWTSLQGMARTLAQGVTSRVQGALERITGGISAIGQAIINLDGAALQAAWARVQGMISGVWQQAQSLASGLMQRVGALWTALRSRFTAMGQSLANMARSVMSRLSSVAEGIRNRIQSTWNTLRNRAEQIGGVAAGVMRAIQAIVNRIVSAARRVWDRIRSGFNAVRQTVARVANSIRHGISSIMQRLRRAARSVWQRITGLFGRLRSWVSHQMQRIMGGVRNLWNRIKSVNIGSIVSTIVKVAPFLGAVKEAVQNPNSVMDPMAQGIASQIEGGMPGAAINKAREHMAGAGTSSPSSAEPAAAGVPVQRTPARNRVQRTPVQQPLSQGTLWNAFVGALEEKWEKLSVWEVVKETLWTLVWPWPAVGREFTGLVDDLTKVVNRMTTDGLGFWRHLIDIPLIIWRRINNVLMHLYGWFLLASVILGAIAGAVGGPIAGAILGFMGGAGVGAVPGAAAGEAVGVAAGAGIGLGFALGVGEGLLVSFLAAEAASFLKAYIDLGAVDQTDEEQNEDLNQMANSAIGLGIAAVLFMLSAVAARLARGFLNRITSVRWQQFTEGVEGGFRRGSPFRRGGGRGDGESSRAPREGEPEGRDCFIPGTLVWTSTGQHPIERLAVNDRVLAYDPHQDCYAYHPVVANFERTAPYVLRLQLADHTITCSPEHPFLSESGAWRPAGELVAGDQVLTITGGWQTIESITHAEGTFAVYNLTVAGFHTFLVGAAGVVVHNKSARNRSTPELEAAQEAVFERLERTRGRVDTMKERLNELPDTAAQKDNLRTQADQMEQRINSADDNIWEHSTPEEVRTNSDPEVTGIERDVGTLEGQVRAERLREFSNDPQTGAPNAKSISEAQTILDAEQAGMVQSPRRPNLSQGEPNLDFVIDGPGNYRYGEIKTPQDPANVGGRTIQQQAGDISGKLGHYDSNVRVLVDLRNLSAAQKADFMTAVNSSGADLSNVVFVNP